MQGNITYQTVICRETFGTFRTISELENLFIDGYFTVSFFKIEIDSLSQSLAVKDLVKLFLIFRYKRISIYG